MPNPATRITIPALDRFLKDSKPWGLIERHPEGNWGGKAYDRQRIEPDSKGLLTSLGLKKGDNILVVAGHRANWALALARAGAKVTYSDVSRELADFVKRTVKHRNILGYLCTSYVLCPSIPHQYDWTFTFEAVGPKAFVLLLSLLNRTGGKYVIWDNGDHAQRKLVELSQALTVCKDMYGIKGSILTRHILCTDRAAKKQKRKHHIITIRTSDDARQRMYLDVRLFQFFFKRKKSTSDHLCTLMNCPWEEVKASLDRLSKWCGLFGDKYARTIPLRNGSPTR